MGLIEGEPNSPSEVGLRCLRACLKAVCICDSLAWLGLLAFNAVSSKPPGNLRTGRCMCMCGSCLKADRPSVLLNTPPLCGLSDVCVCVCVVLEGL